MRRKTQRREDSGVKPLLHDLRREDSGVKPLLLRHYRKMTHALRSVQEGAPIGQKTSRVERVEKSIGENSRVIETVSRYRERRLYAS